MNIQVQSITHIAHPKGGAEHQQAPSHQKLKSHKTDQPDESD